MQNNTLGKKIKNFRLRAGLSQMKLEGLIDASPGSISRTENGEVNPTKETLWKIIDVLNLSPKEASSLFLINIESEILVHSLKDKLKADTLEQVLQNAVDLIVFQLGLLSSFITIVEGDRLYAKTATNNWMTTITRKIISVPFETLNISMNENSNLMVRCINEKKPLVDYGLVNFVVPGVNQTIGKFLEKMASVKSGIAIPIILNNNAIGAIFFGKTYIDDYSGEVAALELYAKYIAEAINCMEQSIVI